MYVSQTLSFKLPVYIGDQVVGEVQATNVRENKNRYFKFRHYRLVHFFELVMILFLLKCLSMLFSAKFKTRCYKNGDILVLEGEALALLPNLDYRAVEV